MNVGRFHHAGQYTEASHSADACGLSILEYCEWVTQGVDSGQSQGTFKEEAFAYKEARHGIFGMDYCRTNRGMACWAGDERRWLRRTSRHHSWVTWRTSWRLALWSAGTWGRRWY